AVARRVAAKEDRRMDVIREHVDQVEAERAPGRALHVEQEGEDRIAAAVRAGEPSATSGEVPHRVRVQALPDGHDVAGADRREQIADASLVRMLAHRCSPRATPHAPRSMGWLAAAGIALSRSATAAQEGEMPVR